jgi:autotransporter-associated beta strand protein
LQNFTLGASASNSTALAVIDTTNTVTLSGVISNRSSNQFGSLVKVGTGTVILPNTNTYTGGTTIMDGALIVSGALTGGSLIKIVDSASSRLVLSNTTALASTTSLIGDSALGTTGTLELAAAGDYTLNSYGTTGTPNTAGGNMYFTNSSRSNSTLTFTNATNYITTSSGGGGGRTLANNSADLTINFNGAVDIGSSVSDDVIFGGVGNFVVNGSVFNTNTGARSLIKTGSGTLSLRGPNNTNFTTEVRGGNLNVVSTNLSAQITTNTVAIAFSNGVAAGTYKVLPGALTGAYTSTNFSGLSNGLGAAFNLTSGQVLVSVVPPTSLSYSASTVIGTVDTAISNVTPTVTGEGITYSISPPLPFGLSISSSTGVIRGTPLVSSPSKEYTVTAMNSGGETTAKVTITVNPSGMTFASWSTNATLTSDLLYKYAFGAANKNSEAQKMTSSVTGTNLILTAVVRTNDTAHLTITAKTATNLAGPWSTPASLTESNAIIQGVSDGLVRKDFKVDRGSDTKRFLRLEVLHTQ